MPFVGKRSPFLEPGYDVFVPARHNDPLGLIEGAPLNGGRNYVPWIGISTVRELALKYSEKTRLVDQGDLDFANDVIEQLTHEVADLGAKLAKLEARQEHIDGLMKDGFVPRRTAGRPPRQKVGA